jgi:membrane-associated phospholipid phosphatase
MRAAEWIQSIFASLLAIAAWRLPLQRRLTVSLLAVVVIAVISAGRLAANFLPPLYSSVLRDWLPAVLLLVPYWQTGQFFVAPNHKIQERLAAFDHRLVQALVPNRSANRWNTSFVLFVEIAYFIVYPLVPLGLGVLYVAGQRHYADYYWTVALSATYVCYAITPFVQALPPRMFSAGALLNPPTKLRMLNHWILRHASIQAITFPSAHVASAVAVSLVLLRLTPVIGVFFALAALSIALAAVAGRYHYAADVVWAILIAILVFIGTYSTTLV